MKRTDMRQASIEEKRQQYRAVDAHYREGKSVKVREDRSGFPGVTVDCEDIHLLTDILSLEEWWQEEGRIWSHERPEKDV